MNTCKVVVVRNLPVALGKEDVEREVAKYGTILQCGQKNRNLFVRMSNEDEVDAAVQGLKKDGVKRVKIDVDVGTRSMGQVSKVLVADFENLNAKNEQVVMSCEQVKMLLEDHSREGAVTKIMLYLKGTILKGLIQMATYEDAAKTMSALDSAEVDIGDQTCKLTLSYSDAEVVSINNLYHGKDYITGLGKGECPVVSGSNPPTLADMLNSGSLGKRPLNAKPQQQQQQQQQPKKQKVAPVAAVNVLQNLIGTLPMSQTAPVPMLQLPLKQQHHQEDQAGRVIMVCKIHKEVIPEVLFRLFGTVGKLKSVRILAKQRGSAMLEYETAAMAQRAVEALHRITFYGKDIEVSIAAGSPFKTPPHGSPDYNTTLLIADNDPSHRPSITYKNLPSSKLIISRIPAAYREEDITDIISGFAPDTTITKSVSWETTPAFNTATVTFCNKNIATSILVGLHSAELEGSPPGGLCVVYAPLNPPSKAAAHKGLILYDPTLTGLDNVL